MWGMAHLNVKDMLLKIKNAGYDGVEFGFPLNSTLKDEFQKSVSELSLQTIAQQYDANGDTYTKYKQSFIENLYFLASFKPLFINSHTGKDYYSFEQNSELIQISRKIEQEIGTQIIHETHRGRFPFCIPTTLQYLDAFPDICLTADFSHFCTVSESYLQDQQENLHRIIKYSCHIHARVGFPQSPQITDPRLPEWNEAVEYHLQWWDAIVEHHKSIHTDILTITPEFGPEPYMFSIPVTQMPVANQWDINLYMMQLLKTRYKKIYNYEITNPYFNTSIRIFQHQRFPRY